MCHKKALDRLVTEAVNITTLSKGPPEADLNSKSEWGQPRIPKMRIEMIGQNRPGGNTAEDANPEYKIYNAAVAATIKTGGKRKVKLQWNEEPDQDPKYTEGKANVDAEKEGEEEEEKVTGNGKNQP